MAFSSMCVEAKGCVQNQVGMIYRLAQCLALTYPLSTALWVDLHTTNSLAVGLSSVPHVWVTRI